MSKTFLDYQLSDQINRALIDMNYHQPTAVQQKTIDAILQKCDLIVNAKTGSGKTSAFGIPIVEKLKGGSAAPKALIITPTRELAVQVNTELAKISKYKPVKTTTVYGQHNINVEIEALAKGVDIVTGTPGRVIDHLERRTLYPGDIEYLVLDEADRMLDMGFIDQVMQIIEQVPKQRVTLLFSATMPFEVQTLAWQHMKEPNTIEIESDTKTVDRIEQGYYRVEHNEKRKYLFRLLADKQPDACMVFCNTRRTVERVTDFLKNKGFQAESLHGALSQSRRLLTINKFKRAKFNVLVATDVAARGLHIDEMAMVINYDLPLEKDAYIHRIGRTGRAGSSGYAFSLVTPDDIISLYEIEEHIGVMIGELPLPKYVHSIPKKARNTQDKRRTKGHKSKQQTRKVIKDKAAQAHKPTAEKRVTISKPKQVDPTYTKRRIDEIVAQHKAKSRRSWWRRIVGMIRK